MHCMQKVHLPNLEVETTFFYISNISDLSALYRGYNEIYIELITFSATYFYLMLLSKLKSSSGGFRVK